MEQRRLSDACESKIIRLRKKAPKFYEEKLATLVNQAANELLMTDNRNYNGQMAFNRIHASFLIVLDELAKSQPQGELNFQKERERCQERDRLLKQQIELRTQIEKLEAFELDTDEVGDNENENDYAKVFEQLDHLKSELTRVSHVIATMEGHRVEEEVEKVKLKIPERGILSQLSKEEIAKLEDHITEFLKENQNKKTALYVEKTIIDGMLDRLKLSERFQPVQLNQLSKEVLDSYRSHFREKDREERENWHASLVASKSLLPKEGRILSGPDDVPDDVKRKLDDFDCDFRVNLQVELEKWAQRKESDAPEESVEDEDDEGGMAVPSVRAKLDARKFKDLDNTETIFARTKEEPRDDYVAGTPSDDEMVLRADASEWLQGEDLIQIVDEDIQIIQPRKKARTAQFRREECSSEEEEEIPDCEDDEDEEEEEEEYDEQGEYSEERSDEQQVADEEQYDTPEGGDETDEAQQKAKIEQLDSKKEVKKFVPRLHPKYNKIYTNAQVESTAFKSEIKVQMKDEKKPLVEASGIQDNDANTSKGNADASDDDIEVLGIVEPTDKVQKMNVD